MQVWHPLEAVATGPHDVSPSLASYLYRSVDPCDDKEQRVSTSLVYLRPYSRLALCLPTHNIPPPHLLRLRAALRLDRIPRNTQNRNMPVSRETGHHSLSLMHQSGAVGYGPNFKSGPVSDASLRSKYMRLKDSLQGLGEKMDGIKEEIKGTITRNHDLVQHGKELKSGALKEKELNDVRLFFRFVTSEC
jgi:predicted nucleotidyltransferase